MTLKDFVIEMAGDLLADLGFTHNRNTTWVKVNENGIYFAVKFIKRKVFDETLVHGYMTIQSIFTQLHDREYEIVDIFREMNPELMNPELNDMLFLLLVEPSDDNYGSTLADGRKIIETTLSYFVPKAVDLESCFAANFEASYYQHRRMMCAESLEQYEMIYTDNTFAMVLGLCKIQKYDEAIALLENCEGMSSLCSGWRNLDEFVEMSYKVDEQKEWFINTIRNGEYEKLHEIMRYWYEINCEELKKKYKLTVDYQLSFDE